MAYCNSNDKDIISLVYWSIGIYEYILLCVNLLVMVPNLGKEVKLQTNAVNGEPPEELFATSSGGEAASTMYGLSDFPLVYFHPVFVYINGNERLGA